MNVVMLEVTPLNSPLCTSRHDKMTVGESGGQVFAAVWYLDLITLPCRESVKKISIQKFLNPKKSLFIVYGQFNRLFVSFRTMALAIYMLINTYDKNINIVYL